VRVMRRKTGGALRGAGPVHARGSHARQAGRPRGLRSATAATQSIHSDVFINYDAVTNKFLPGTHVELMQKSTQCLSEFSLDFDRKSSISSTAAVPGSDMTVQSITIDGLSDPPEPAGLRAGRQQRGPAGRPVR